MILITPLLLFVAIVTIMAFPARFCLQRLIPGNHITGRDLLWLTLTLGLGLLSLLIFGVGAFHLFTVPVMLCLLSLILAAGFFHLVLKRNEHRWRLLDHRPQFCPGLESSRILILGIYICIIVALGGALSPEVRGDAIIYHIAQSLLIVVNRGHVDIPSSALTYIPQYQHMLYALGLLLEGDILARLFHWFAGFMLLGGTLSLGNLSGLSRPHSIVAVYLVAVFPIWTYLATSCYVDLATANYVLASLCCLLWRTQNRALAQTPLLLLAAFMAGLAMGTKYTAMLVGFLPLICVLAWQELRVRREQIPRAALNCILFAIVSCLTFTPWLLRNYLYTGNPLAPSLLHTLGPAGVPQSTLAWPDIQPGDPTLYRSPLRLLSAYAAMLSAFGDYGNYLPLIAIVLGIVVLATRRTTGAFPPIVQCLLVFLIISFLVGVPSGTIRRDSRYIMAHVSVLAVLVVLWAEQLRLVCFENARWYKSAVAVGLAALFALYAHSTWIRFRDLNETLFPPMSLVARNTYLRERLQNFDANQELGKLRISSEEKVLGAYYPAHVHYVMLGAPLRDTFLAGGAADIKPEHLRGLKREHVGWIFGTVRQDLIPYLEHHSTHSGMPLYKIVRTPES